jgi:predicted Zn-dependent protease
MRTRAGCGKVTATREAGVSDLYEEYNRAMLFLDAGDPVEAARILQPVLAAEPGNAEVRTQLARAYFNSAQLRRAEEQARWLVDRDPSDHYAHFLLGRALERQSRPADALPHLRMAEAMRPCDDYSAAVRRVRDRVRPAAG